MVRRSFDKPDHHRWQGIRCRRLEAVRRDLTDPLFAHRSIAGIAARWCFTDQAHFTRTFRARYGVTPSTARRTAAA